MGILDAAVHIGVESTYGTPVTPTRSFEAKADGFKTSREAIESVGMRAAMHTVRSDRRVWQNFGSEGTIEVDVLNKGMGMLFRTMLTEAASAPVQQAATAAYLGTFNSAADAPSKSLTVQVIRPQTGGTNTPFTHHGAVATGWKLSQAIEDFLVLSVDYDCEDVDTVTAAATAAYPSSASPFHWGQCVVTVGGVAMDVRSFEFTADLGLKTNRRYLRGSDLKKQPIRGARPTYTGKLEADFDATTRYDEFVAGTVTSLVATWTGTLIASSYYNLVRLTLPAIQWTGESPEASTSDLSMQPLPFKVLHDGSNPAVKLEYQSTDTAF